MKFKVMKDFPTPDGMLYSGELVREHAQQGGAKDHIRVKDSTGRIWFVPKNILKKA